jgi:hypothetical protein
MVWSNPQKLYPNKYVLHKITEFGKCNLAKAYVVVHQGFQ